MKNSCDSKPFFLCKQSNTNILLRDKPFIFRSFKAYMREIKCVFGVFNAKSLHLVKLVRNYVLCNFYKKTFIVYGWFDQLFRSKLIAT